MPVTYEIDEKMGLVRARASGEASWRDHVEASQRWYADARYAPGMPVLLDIREQSSFGTAEGVRGARDATAASLLIRPGTRVAIVVESDISFGLSRMFASMSAGGPLVTRVFRDIEEAEAWLFID